MAHRIIIWNNAVGHFKNKLITGSGFDATRGLYSQKDRIELRFPDKAGGKKWGPILYEPIPLHPHNAILQVWLELGAFGTLILLALLVSVVRAIARFIKDGLERAVAFGSLTTGLVIASMVVVLAPSFGKEGRGKIAPDDGDEKTVEELGSPRGP